MPHLCKGPTSHVGIKEFGEGSPECQNPGGSGRGGRAPLMHMDKQVSKWNPFHWNFPTICLCLEQKSNGGRGNISALYFSSIKHQKKFKKKERTASWLS